MNTSGIYCVRKNTRDELPTEVDTYLVEDINAVNFFAYGQLILYGEEPGSIDLEGTALNETPQHIGTKPLDHIAEELNPWTIELVKVVNPQEETFRDYQHVPLSPTHFVDIFKAVKTIRSYDSVPEMRDRTVRPQGDMVWEERREDWFEDGPRDMDTLPEDIVGLGPILTKLGIKHAHGAREVGRKGKETEWGIGEDRIYVGDIHGEFQVAHIRDSSPFNDVPISSAVIDAPTDYETGDAQPLLDQRLSILQFLDGYARDFSEFHSTHAEKSGGWDKIETKLANYRAGMIQELCERWSPEETLSPKRIVENKHFSG